MRSSVVIFCAVFCSITSVVYASNLYISPSLNSDKFNYIDNNYKFNGTLHIHNKESYLIASTSILVGSLIASVGILYIMPTSVTNWDKSEGIFGDFKGVMKRWVNNVSHAPTIDKDDIWLNYIAHPYGGSIYYLQARMAGYGAFGSFAYSTFVSTILWEYGVEAFAERPSLQDLIITPVAGSVLGELFYNISTHIIKNNEKIYNSKFLGLLALSLMNPGYLIMEHTAIHNYASTNEYGESLNINNSYKNGLTPIKKGLGYYISIPVN